MVALAEQECVPCKGGVAPLKGNDLKKLAAAWQPLYQTLMPDQKRRLGLLTMIALRELRDRAEQRRIEAADEEE